MRATLIQDKRDTWNQNLVEVAKKPGAGEISALQWQKEMNRIYGDTPIPNLLKLINFDDLKQSMMKHDMGA